MNTDACINLLLFNILFAYVQIRLRYRENEETFELRSRYKLRAVIEIEYNFAGSLVFDCRILARRERYIFMFIRKRDDDITYIVVSRVSQQHPETELTEIANLGF